MRRRALFFAELFVYVWIRLGRDLLGQSAVGVTMTHATSGTPKQLEKRRRHAVHLLESGQMSAATSGAEKREL